MLHIEPNSGLVFTSSRPSYYLSSPYGSYWKTIARALLISDGALITYWEGVIH